MKSYMRLKIDSKCNLKIYEIFQEKTDFVLLLYASLIWNSFNLYK